MKSRNWIIIKDTLAIEPSNKKQDSVQFFYPPGEITIKNKKALAKKYNKILIDISSVTKTK